MRIQQRLNEWRAINFTNATAEDQLIGMMEELGELSHAFLKHRQEIRNMTDEQYELEARDAIGDLTIFMMGFCSFHGWDFEATVNVIAEKVMKRNWKEDPDHGGEEDPSEDR